MSNYKSGFVAICGRANAGKSTLLNKIIGEKISIVSSKPQTTRNSILGVHTTDHCQIIFVDTPGIHKPRNSLGARMEKSIKSAIIDVNAVIYVMDCTVRDNEWNDEESALKSVIREGTPVILALNKVDKVAKENLLPLIAKAQELHEFAAIIPISAQKGDNIAQLLAETEKYINEGPKYFPDDVITDQPERQIVREIIREKALRLLNKEIPHGIAVEIEKWIESEERTSIYAAIYCEKNSHKGIVIGKGGEKLKQIGQNARADIEKLLGHKVYLELWVRVKEDWRNRESFISSIMDEV
ncbi:MAG: GTPase Era [Oscillospiraceae bacterium]|nr:GTPase Era [Oscillospiraceae bacterium]